MISDPSINQAAPSLSASSICGTYSRRNRVSDTPRAAEAAVSEYRKSGFIPVFDLAIEIDNPVSSGFAPGSRSGERQAASTVVLVDDYYRVV